MYSTTNDLSIVGRAILSSSLISSTITRRWFKPLSFTSALQFAVGAPWEIFRVQLSHPRRIIDVFTKDGGFGSYVSMLALVPDLDIGFTVIAAGPVVGPNGGAAAAFADLLAQHFIIAAEQAARLEAATTYAGNYKSNDVNLNSSMVISASDASPGLVVDSWISNGTDMVAIYATILLGLSRDNVGVRLYPTSLVSRIKGAPKQVSWRAVFEPRTEVFTDSLGSPVFQRKCAAWGGVDSFLYGSVAVDEFLFVLTEDGIAKSVEPRVLRASYHKQ